jgi:hypothetical protein
MDLSGWLAIFWLLVGGMGANMVNVRLIRGGWRWAIKADRMAPWLTCCSCEIIRPLLAAI